MRRSKEVLVNCSAALARKSLRNSSAKSRAQHRRCTGNPPDYMFMSLADL
jgi:hypothetical protein